MNFALAPDAAGLDSAKGMNETAILQRIRLDLGLEPTVRLFRNNVGVLRDAQGRPVRFGLHPGSGDLIGWRSVRITPDMVGRLLAVLASVEVKTATGVELTVGVTVSQLRDVRIDNGEKGGELKVRVDRERAAARGFAE